MAYIGELPLVGALLIVAGLALCALCVFWVKESSPDRSVDRQRQAKQDGQAAAAEHEFGAFVSLRQAEWSVPGDGHSEYRTVTPFLVVLAMPAGAMIAAHVALWWLGLLVSVVGVAAGWLSARWLRKETTRYVLWYEKGFVLRGEKAVHAFRWTDITKVRETIRKESYHGHHFIVKKYQLNATGNRRAKIKDAEFGAIILSHVPAARPKVTAATPAPRAPIRSSDAVRSAAADAVLRSAAAAARRADAATAAASTATAQPADAVPPRIAEVATRLGLGEPRGRAADSIRVTLIVLALSVVGPAVIIAPLAASGSAGQRLAGPLLVVAFFAVFILPIWARVSTAHARRSRCTCYLFTGGLVLTGLFGRVRAFATWDDVAAVYWQWRGANSHRPPPPGNAYRVWVLRRGQRVLTMYLSKTLAPELIRLQSAAALPGLATRLAAGEALSFGPFRVSPAGVDDGLGAVSWDEITGCETIRGRICIAQQGQPRLVQVERRYVPDVLVFEQLVKTFAGHPWAGAPAGTAATGPGDAHTVRDGWRNRLLTALTPLVVTRLAMALGGGAAFALGGIIWYAIPPAGPKLSAAVLLSIPYFPIVAGIAYVVISAVLWRGVRSLTSAAAVGRPPMRRRWLAGVVVLAAVIVFWRVASGSVLDAVAGAVLTALPALLVLALGGWAYLLTERSVKASRHRWFRHAYDLPVAVAVGIAVLQLIHRDLLADQPAAAALFPLGAWCTLWIWRRMGRSPRLSVRAGADLVLSLLLGADLVLFLVWLANLLDLSEPEVAFLRGVLQRIGAVADLPWWLWLGLLVLLAATNLVFAIWPGRLRSAIRWSGRLHVVPSVDVGSRLLTGLHIGLLVVVLVGLSLPPGLDTVLRGPLRTTYTVTVQRELEGTGEQAAYAAIRRQFSSSRGTPSVGTLTAIVSQIHNISGPPPGNDNATSAEDDLARQVGEIQALALGLSTPQQVQAAATAAATATGFDPPVNNASDLSERLSKLSVQQQQAATVKRLVEQTGDLAAAAIARTLFIPNVGENELVQVVREYLSGLVEDSPLKDVFAAWAARLVSHLSPPPAAELVVPDPGQLDQAATTTLADDRAKARLNNSVGTDPATLTESAAAAAVELASQSLLVSEGSTSCYECTQVPGVPDEPANQPNGPEEDPVEHDFVP